MTTPNAPVGIVAVGVAIPRARLARKSIDEAFGVTGARAAAGERVVANHDEDSLTLMVQAALEAAGDGLPHIDVLITATTSPPGVEKSSAALVVEACDGAPAIRTIDIGGTRRSGLDALWLADQIVTGGGAKRVLVCVADARPVEPRSPLEARAGEAGSAFVLARADAATPLASIESWGHSHAEAWDVWRREGEPVQSEDTKGVREAAFERPLKAALAKMQAEKATRVVCAGPDAKTAQALAKRLGATLVEAPGDCGCATAPLAIVAALRGAAENDSIVAIAYGDGVRAMRLRCGPSAAKSATPSDKTRPITYVQALVLRGQLGTLTNSPEIGSALLAAEAEGLLRWHAARCSNCQAVSYPPSQLCVGCASPSVTRFRLARRGVVFTFTRDHLFESPDAVTTMCVIDLDGGGRVYLQATDCAPTDIDIGVPVEIVCRRIHDGGGHPNYYWKCRPI